MYISNTILNGSSAGVPSWCVYLILGELVFSLLTIVLMCLITAESAKPNVRYLSQLNQQVHRNLEHQRRVTNWN